MARFTGGADAAFRPLHLLHMLRDAPATAVSVVNWNTVSLRFAATPQDVGVFRLLGVAAPRCGALGRAAARAALSRVVMDAPGRPPVRLGASVFGAGADGVPLVRLFVAAGGRGGRADVARILAAAGSDTAGWWRW